MEKNNSFLRYIGKRIKMRGLKNVYRRRHRKHVVSGGCGRIFFLSGIFKTDNFQAQKTPFAREK